ncbi:FRG domain-containing protein [Vibrio harveyi]|uniref:FRG domain-containing protein n=1 Tax=Vibrio harveyi TaxID=669 RepID=A0A8B3D889_VIBHA|nr:FRG domain-containing protein [Vibrio harveyi]RIW01198.1 FRG domain-containing protein [Vibrio harveyi]HDM8130322.1 FRG domain-containing protein [Vibrio harveyi]
MQLLQTEIFGKIAKPESFDELMNFICSNTYEESYFLTRMWRGQSDVSWPIHSGAYRRINPSSDRELVSYEKRLLNNATHRGYRFVDGRELTDLELLARLQHHGAATRLLDTSRNALIALWFCCASSPNKTGLLAGIHTDHLGGYEGEVETKPYEDVMTKIMKFNHPFTWEPTSVTNRIAAQSSQFLFSKISTDKWGSISLPKKEGATLFIAISPTLKEQSLTVLQQVFDIHHLTLFPDIDGFSLSHSHDRDEFSNNRW